MRVVGENTNKGRKAKLKIREKKELDRRDKENRNNDRKKIQHRRGKAKRG